MRWTRCLALLGLLTALLAWPAPAAPDATDSLRLDSLKRLVEFYERQQDYEEAYRYGVEYTELRDRLAIEAAQRLMHQYERDFADEDLENARVNLMKQQALIELQQVENEVQLTRLKNAQDSIALMNQLLDRQNRRTQDEIALKRLEQQEEQQRSLIAHRKARVAVLWSVIAALALVIVLCAAYLWSNVKALRKLDAERLRAQNALDLARKDEETQDAFLNLLTQEIRTPVDRIVEDAHLLADEHAAGEQDGRTHSPAESVDDLHQQIARLLEIADGIIEQCSGKRTERLMRTVVTALVMLSLAHAPTRAQNNPYGIRDDLYTYFRQADLRVQDPIVLNMSDTLLTRAQKAKDGMAMCLAYDLRVGHAYFGRDLTVLRKAIQDLQKCALATGNENYVFYGWNRLLLRYINEEDFVNATEETRKYQQEALRLNNTYGISRGHYYMGDIFKARGMLREATEQYQLAVDFLMETGARSEISSAYARLGEICIENGDYPKAEFYLTSGLNHAQKEYEKINPYLGLFDLYVTAKNAPKAEEIIPPLMHLKEIGQLMGNRNKTFMNTLVKYYLLTGRREEALATLDSIGDRHPRTKFLTYAAVDDYERALEYVYVYNRSTKAAEAITDAARLAALKAEYNNRLTERNNNELALDNARLRTEQLKAEQAVGTERIRQDSLQLSHIDLKEDAEEADRTLRRTEEAVKMEAMQREEEQMRTRRNILHTVAIVLMAVMIFAIAKTVARRRNARQLLLQKTEAERATVRALEASERKRNFLEQITHELRTPLNAVMGFSEVLGDEQLVAACSEEERADFRLRIREGAASLQSLVDCSLQLCDISTGKVKPQRESFALAPLMEELCDAYRPKADDGVYVECIVDPKDIAADSDRALLRQALALLMDNACKFTHQGHIHLMCEPTPDGVEIAVDDTGCGIPEEKAEKVFEHFEKVDSFVPGIGLGLTLCRAIVHLMGGEVRLDTEYEGGARFVVTL